MKIYYMSINFNIYSALEIQSAVLLTDTHGGEMVISILSWFFACLRLTYFCQKSVIRFMCSTSCISVSVAIFRKYVIFTPVATVNPRLAAVTIIIISLEILIVVFLFQKFHELTLAALLANLLN